MKIAQRLPDEVLTRLATYHDVLVRLEGEGVERVQSHELARECDVRADRVRADLSRIQLKGVKGSGYDVHVLRINLARQLHIEDPRKVLLVGTSARAEAFLLMVADPPSMVEVVGVFAPPGVEPMGALVGGRPLESFDTLAATVHAERVRFAVVATKASEAQATVNALQTVGVTAVLNLSGEVVRRPSGVVVETASPMLSFKRLSFRAPRRPVGQGTLGLT